MWDGDPECEHEWGNSSGCPTKIGKQGSTETRKHNTLVESMGKPQSGQFCVKCGAWLGCLGLEPSPELYIDHLVQIFREVRRVLRKDGTCWINIGDSYAGSGKGAWSNTEEQKEVYVPDVNGVEASMPKVPNGLKPKDMVLIPFRLALALQADGWWIRSDIIWHKPNCLGGSARVYAQTQKGEMPMMVKDMVRLDPATVKLWNGTKWTPVISWTENHYPLERLEIELRSGEKISCTGEHLWPTDKGNVEAHHLQVGDILQHTRLPEPLSCKNPEMLNDEETGWFVGMYLAEGSRGEGGKCIQITSHVAELHERYRRLSIIAQDYHGTCAMHKTGGQSATVNLHSPVLNGIIDTYISGKLAKGKHLNMKCWERSDGFLFALLAGYLEGDGHDDPKNDRWRIGFTRNKSLADDLRTLCGRLGIYLRLHNAHAMCDGKKFPTYRGEIRFEKSDHRNAKHDTEIVSIHRSRASKFWDIAVADAPHVFALASGVLTHNCMPSSVKDRPTTDFEHVFLLAKSKRYFYDQDAIREPQSQGTLERYKAGEAIPPKRKWSEHTDKGGSSKTHMQEHIEAKRGQMTAILPGGRNKRTVWKIPTRPYPDAHFATFPPKLIEPMILAGSSDKACPHCGAAWVRVVDSKRLTRPELPKDDPRYRPNTYTGAYADINGKADAGYTTRTTLGFQPSCDCPDNDGSGASIVFDPFSGSGTTCAEAKRLGRHYFGIEANPDYIELSKKRLEETVCQPNMFGDLWKTQS